MWKWLHLGVTGGQILAGCFFLIVAFTVPNRDAICFDSENWKLHFGTDLVLARERQYEVPIRDRINNRSEFLGWMVWELEIYHRPPCFRGPPKTRKFTNHLLVSIPSWHIAILTAIYPAIFFIRNYRRRRAQRQALQPCGQCGYDLTGNESGTCPECGTAITASSKTEVAG